MFILLYFYHTQIFRRNIGTVRNRVYLNTHDIPVRKENESAQDFNDRMEYFRKTDLRISIPNIGMVNFAFDHCYTVGVGTIGNGDDKPRIKMVNGEIDYFPSPIFLNVVDTFQ